MSLLSLKPGDECLFFSVAEPSVERRATIVKVGRKTVSATCNGVKNGQPLRFATAGLGGRSWIAQSSLGTICHEDTYRANVAQSTLRAALTILEREVRFCQVGNAKRMQCIAEDVWSVIDRWALREAVAT